MQDCQYQEANLQFLNKEDALAVTARGNAGRIPIAYLTKDSTFFST